MALIKARYIPRSSLNIRGVIKANENPKNYIGLNLHSGLVQKRMVADLHLPVILLIQNGKANETDEVQVCLFYL